MHYCACIKSHGCSKLLDAAIRVSDRKLCARSWLDGSEAATSVDLIFPDGSVLIREIRGKKILPNDEVINSYYYINVSN